MSLAPPHTLTFSNTTPDDFRRSPVAYALRQEPHVVGTDSPLTPPLSPRYGPQAGNINIDEGCASISPEDQHEMNIQRARVPPSSELMDIDSTSTCATEEDVPPVVRRPKRNLEDERVHLHHSGVQLSDFEVRGTLGTGTFGKVLLVRHKSAPRPGVQSCFAMKVMRKTEIDRLRQVEHVKAERYILSRVNHPFVVDLFATFQDSVNVYMLMSYVPGGELFTHLRRAQRFSPDVTRFYLSTIIVALRYLHSFNIVYRDLKPENLLLDSLGYLRLTDFGFAKIVDERTWTLCGTPEYLAPEVINNNGHGKAADWWACGVLCYEMLVGYPPFFDDHPYGIYEKILRGDIYWPKCIDDLSRNLIASFLHPDRTKRLGNLIGGPDDILVHPWFKGVNWEKLERREIKAPIVPRTSSFDDTRHFLTQPLPPSEDIPGLTGQDPQSTFQQRFDPIAYKFLEF